jgi:hypothetical protein
MLALLVMVAFKSQATLLLEEHFNYITTNLTGNAPAIGGVWGGSGATVVQGTNLAAPSGFPASSGNSYKFGASGAAQTNMFATQNSGTVYISYLIQFNNYLGTATGRGVDIGGLSLLGAAEYCQLEYSNVTGNAYFQMGLGGRSTALGPLLTNQYTTGETHLIVVGYTFVAGTANDIMSLWIDPTSLGGTEPAATQTMIVTSEPSSPSSLNTVDFKNSSSVPANTILDELRVATTWAEVTSEAAPSASCNLVFLNTDPAQFIQTQSVTTNLPFGLRNLGSAASNVTVSVTSTNSWLTVNTGMISIPLLGSLETVTNIFNVTIASNAIGGVYADAFTVTMQGTGADGITSNSSAQVSLQIRNTAFSSMSKTAFAADTNAIDTATLTVSNTSAEVLSFVLSDALSAPWISYPVGTLTLDANSSTSITVTVSSSLTAGLGVYSNTLSVQYLNSASTPNPANFPLSFYVGPDLSTLLVVNLAGNYNTGTGNINFLMPTVATNGEALIYDNDFGTAIVTNGAVSTGGSYTGQTVYASFRHTMTGGTNAVPPLAPVVMRVASTDSLTFYGQNTNTAGEANLAAALDIMYVFKKADFLNGRNTGSVVFDASSSFSVTSGSYNASTKLLRAVVQNGNSWYISQASNTVASASTNPKIILTNASEALWAVWDPLSSIDVSTLPDFSTTVAGSTFTDIQAVGIYSHVTKYAVSGTVFQIGFSSIQIGGVSGGAASSYTLTGGVTGGNGSVSPASVNVAAGANQNFSVAASNYYRIASLTANGTPVGIVFDNDSIATNFTWMNVQAAGALVATFTAQVASDPAGTPYWWLAQYGLTNFNAEAVDDQDKDGLSAWQEYIAGTDPTNIASSFRIVENPRNVLNWNAASGRLYSVYCSTNLLNGFQSLATDIAAPQSSYTNVTTVPNANYQIRVRMP